jgi:hypothetical protein
MNHFTKIRHQKSFDDRDKREDHKVNEVSFLVARALPQPCLYTRETMGREHQRSQSTVQYSSRGPVRNCTIVEPFVTELYYVPWYSTSVP